MGGVRVQSPYKLLMGCTGAKSTYQGSVHAYSSQVGRELENILARAEKREKEVPTILKIALLERIAEDWQRNQADK